MLTDADNCFQKCISLLMAVRTPWLAMAARVLMRPGLSWNRHVHVDDLKNKNKLEAGVTSLIFFSNTNTYCISQKVKIGSSFFYINNTSVHNRRKRSKISTATTLFRLFPPSKHVVTAFQKFLLSRHHAYALLK